MTARVLEMVIASTERAVTWIWLLNMRHVPFEWDETQFLEVGFCRQKNVFKWLLLDVELWKVFYYEDITAVEKV